MFKSFILSTLLGCVFGVGAIPIDPTPNRAMSDFGTFISIINPNYLYQLDDWNVVYPNNLTEVDAVTGEGYSFNISAPSIDTFSFNISSTLQEYLINNIRIDTESGVRGETFNGRLYNYVPMLQIYKNSSNYINIWIGLDSTYTNYPPFFYVFKSFTNSRYDLIKPIFTSSFGLSNGNNYTQTITPTGTLYSTSQISEDFVNVTISLSYDDYTLGFDEGYDTGDVEGYNRGKQEGFDLGYNATTSLFGLFAIIADVPINMIYSMFSFDVFGTPLFAGILGLFTILVSISLLVILVRFLIKFIH